MSGDDISMGGANKRIHSESGEAASSDPFAILMTKLNSMDDKSDTRHIELTGKVRVIEQNVAQLQSTTAASQVSIRQLQASQAAVTGRLDALEAGSGAASVASGSSTTASLATPTSNPYSTTPKIPVGKRTTICVGGFQYSESDDIHNFLKELFATEPGYKRAFAIGGYTTRGKVEFNTSDHMWAYLVKMKGKKISSSLAHPDRPRDPEDQLAGLLWHNVDKTNDELALGRKSNYAKSLLVTALQTVYDQLVPEVLDKAVDANKDAGSVVLLRRLLPGVTPTTPIKIYTRKPGDTIAAAAGAQEWLDSIQAPIQLENTLAEVNDPPRQ